MPDDPRTPDAPHPQPEQGGGVAVAPTPAPTPARTRPRPASKPDPERPWLWHVVLLDDDAHTYEYVMAMMQELFAHPLERAFQIAQRVDAEGRAICLTTHKEHAELKLEQIRAFGADPLIASCKGAMSARLEPALDGADGAHGNDGNGR